MITIPRCPTVCHCPPRTATHKMRDSDRPPVVAEFPASRAALVVTGCLVVAWCGQAYRVSLALLIGLSMAALVLVVGLLMTVGLALLIRTWCRMTVWALTRTLQWLAQPDHVLTADQVAAKRLVLARLETAAAQCLAKLDACLSRPLDWGQTLARTVAGRCRYRRVPP